MSTNIRPELSEKNEYWIDRHRYYELKHFCLQYPLWRRAYQSLLCYPDAWPRAPYPHRANTDTDPVTANIDARLFCSDRMNMLERAARDTDETLACYILKAVTEGISYDHLRVQTDIPCCKDVYYDMYRRFFWLLSQARQ